MALDHLFSPIMLGKVRVRNRIAMAPMGIGVVQPDETVPDFTIAYIEARAKGGVGLIISQSTRATWYQSSPRLGTYDDRFIPWLRRYVSAVKAHGASAFLQIGALGGKDPLGSVAPSAIESPLYKVPPRELTREEIKEIINDFIQAAGRAKEAGFDGVELHGAHSYLIGEFISPHSNHRTDEYGGDFEGQMRVPVEIVRGIKRLCGSDFPVGFKFSAHEELPNGVSHDLAPKIAQRMAEEGVAYLHVSSTASTIEALSDFPSVPPIYMPRNTLVPLAENVKRHVKDVPIIATGSITHPADADEIIASGKADMVAIGRGLLADPDWARKAETGERIVPCIRCNVCHYEAVFKTKRIKCAVNPSLTKEKETMLMPAKKLKRVMVAGGGPAGMTAALLAARRGHEVVLYETSRELGGLMIPSCNPPIKDAIRELLDYYRAEIADSDIEVELGVEVTPELVEKVSPDALIIAVGGSPIIPSVPGIESERVVTAIEALKHRDVVQGEEVVVVGGGDVGCETALYLAQAGKRVTVVEMLDELMQLNEIKNNTIVLAAMLEEAGVKAYTKTRLVGVTPFGVEVVGLKGETQELPADAVVIAIGIAPKKALVRDMEKSCLEAYAIGDCVNPAKLVEAIHEADRVGRAV